MSHEQLTHNYQLHVLHSLRIIVFIISSAHAHFVCDRGLYLFSGVLCSGLQEKSGDEQFADRLPRKNRSRADQDRQTILPQLY
jgi:hypothetical protein